MGNILSYSMFDLDSCWKYPKETSRYTPPNAPQGNSTVSEFPYTQSLLRLNLLSLDNDMGTPTPPKPSALAFETIPCKTPFTKTQFFWIVPPLGEANTIYVKGFPKFWAHLAHRWLRYAENPLPVLRHIPVMYNYSLVLWLREVSSDAYIPGTIRKIGRASCRERV